MKSRFSRFALLFALLIPRLLYAEPQLSEKYDYYDVDGHSAAELKRGMDGSGISENGKTYYAYTKWYVKWNYTYQEEGGRCRITSVGTTLDVTYQLPRWRPVGDRPAALLGKWDLFYKALKKHEEGHKDFGVKAARDIELAIRQMAPRPSCPALEAAANALGDGIVSKYAEQEKKYDQNTGHGRTQGAVFP